MKLKTVFTIIFSIAIFQFSFAQELTEILMPMSQGSNNALIIALPKTDAKTAEKAWGKFIKDYDGKTKKNKKTGEIFTDNAMIEAMSKNTVDIYTVVKKQKEGSQIIVWFDLGGAYLASATHPDQYEVATTILNKFSSKISVGLAEEAFKIENEALNKEESKLSKLDKNEADMKKSIADYQKKIKALEEDIKKNAEARKTQAETVEAQRIKMEKTEKVLKSIKK